MTKPNTHPRSSTYPGRIPGAGLIADLHDVVMDLFPVGDCTECETTVAYDDDAAELTLEIVKFLRDKGIELDR